MDVASSEFHTDDGMYDLDFKVCALARVEIYSAVLIYPFVATVGTPAEVYGFDILWS